MTSLKIKNQGVGSASCSDSEEYYDELNIGKKVTMEGQLEIKTMGKVDEDFVKNLLEELIVAELSGEEFVSKCKEV